MNIEVEMTIEEAIKEIIILKEKISVLKDEIQELNMRIVEIEHQLPYRELPYISRNTVPTHKI